LIAPINLMLAVISLTAP